MASKTYRSCCSRSRWPCDSYSINLNGERPKMIEWLVISLLTGYLCLPVLVMFGTASYFAYSFHDSY